MKIWKDKSPEYICCSLGLFLIAAGILFGTLQITGILSLHRALPPCYFYAATHIPCPGCGMTRAIESFFSFHFLSSFRYHPIVIYIFIFYALFLSTHTWALIINKLRKPSAPIIRGMKFRIGYIYFGIFVMFAQWFVKLFLLF